MRAETRSRALLTAARKPRCDRPPCAGPERPVRDAQLDQSVNGTLNERQLTLLRRIAENSAPVLPSEHHLAVSIYALRSRRLVTTAGQRRFWTAAITELGRAVLEPGALPHATKASSEARTDNRSGPGPQPVDQVRGSGVADAVGCGKPRATPSVSPPAVPVLERLVRPHPIIAATRDGAKRSSDGWPGL